MYQTSDPEVYFFEDFNRGFTWTEAYTYPYDLTGGADATGNFWNIVPDQEGGYLTNVQLGTGCWNGTVPAEVNIKSARLFAFIPHTLGSSTIVVRHRFDVEGEGEGMAMLVNGVNVPPDGGFIYNGLGSYWTGSSGGWVESSFTVPPHPVPGDVEEIRFISQAADEIDNCESSGYSGWQIDWIQISG
jgi:hypothetical protein